MWTEHRVYTIFVLNGGNFLRKWYFRCTLGSDKVLINRRNVVTEVKKRYAASRKFLEVELETRVLAATLTSLRINSLDDTPDETVLPCDLQNASKPDKEVPEQLSWNSRR